MGSGAGLHRCPVDVIEPAGQSRRELVAGRDAKQPVSQPVVTRKPRGIGHCQAGDDEHIARGGHRRIRVRPQPLGAASDHRLAMMADHLSERRGALALILGLPEAPHQCGIGMSHVVRGYESHPTQWPFGPAGLLEQQSNVRHVTIGANRYYRLLWDLCGFR